MMKKLLRMILKIWYLLSGNCQAVTGKVQNWYAKELKVRTQSYGSFTTHLCAT